MFRESHKLIQQASPGVGSEYFVVGIDSSSPYQHA